MSEADVVFQAYKTFLERQRAAARYARAERVLSALIVLTIVAFLVTSFFLLRRNYTYETLGPEITREMNDLTPEISRALFEVADDVIPHYVELGSAEFEEILPELEDAIMKQLDAVWHNARLQLRRDFDDALERSAQRIQASLSRKFPEINTPEGLAAVEQQLTLLLEKDSQEMLDRFFDRYTRDLYQLYQTLEKFRPSPFDRLEREELVLNYIHLWLMALDYELMGVS